MSYTPTTWVNGTTPLSQTHLNNLETQYTAAITSFNQDLFPSGFVLFGMVCSKDVSTANQLDVTSGVAYLEQTDFTFERFSISASTPGQFTTSTINTTYHLYLLQGGTLTFGTSTLPALAQGTIAICTATTDGSGNILVVTDVRQLNLQLFNTSVGTVAFGNTVSGTAGSGGMSIDQMGSVVSLGPLPATAPTATPVSGTGLGVGNYSYKVAMVSYSGQSSLGSAGSCTTTSSNKKVNLTNIPTGGTGVLSRNIYRTAVGGSAYFLLTTISDNSTTTYTDIIADGSLGVAAPVHPTMGATQWKGNGGLLLAAVYGDGAMYFDTGTISSDGSGDLYTNELVFNNITSDMLASGTNNARFFYNTNTNSAVYKPAQTSSTNTGHIFQSWNGSSAINNFSIGGQFSSAVAYIDQTGNAFVHASVNSISGSLFLDSLQSGAASGVVLEAWTGAANVVPFSVGGQFASALSYIDANGNYVGGGYFSGGVSGTAATLTNNATITTSNVSVARTTNSGSVTGIILAAGSVNGQEISVTNETTNTVTFAASGTSHVAGGTGVIIAANTQKVFVWVSANSLWYSN